MIEVEKRENKEKLQGSIILIQRNRNSQNHNLPNIIDNNLPVESFILQACIEKPKHNNILFIIQFSLFPFQNRESEVRKTENPNQDYRE